MTVDETLELIKTKRKNAYNDYTHKTNLSMKLKKDTTEYKDIRNNINNLAITINTYDDLIIEIENQIAKEKNK